MQAIQITLTDYVTIVAGLPRPTTQQTEGFARFVSHAHSWYKHLPLFPPGVPFCFFLDPSAGMQHVVGADGSLRVVKREGKGFHYSWIPTAEYRTRFGYLSFSRSRGSSVSLVGEDGQRLIPSDEAPVVYDPDRAQLCALPEMVVEAGTTMVSGVVHTHTAACLWRFGLEWTKPLDWPAESGGDETLHKIAARCQLLTEAPSKQESLSFEQQETLDDPAERENIYLTSVDWPLYRLLAPEQRRQQQLMVEAMHRVLNVIFPRVVQ